MNRLNLSGCVFAIAVLLASSAGLPAADEQGAVKYRLQYRFEAGQSVYFTVRNETQRSFQYKVARAEMREGTDSLKHYRVLSVTDDGGAVLELTIDRTLMWVKQDDEFFVYDSTKGGKPPAAFADVDGTIGKPWLHVTVSPRGETLVATTPGGTDALGADKKDQKGELKSSDFLSRVLPLLPADEIAVGTKWKEPFTVPVPEGDKLMKQARLQRVYQLVNVEGDLATIEMKTEPLSPDRTPEQEARIAQIMYQGTITLNHTRGLLVGRDLHINKQVPMFDGPGTEMTLVVSQQDAIATAGAATPAPENPAPPVAAATLVAPPKKTAAAKTSAGGK